MTKTNKEDLLKKVIIEIKRIQRELTGIENYNKNSSLNKIYISLEKVLDDMIIINSPCEKARKR